MPHVIRVRDVARGGVYDFGPDEPMLRVPYDLFLPDGAVRRRGDVVDWAHADVPRSGRVVPGVLGEAHPGERVLLRPPPSGSDDEWWLCEVEAVDGVAAAQ